MIHLDNGGNNELYRHWFDQYLACGGADFDYIGMSYYPFWHGTLAALEANMNDVALRYHKDILVAEVSMGFTMEDYQSYEKLPEGKASFTGNRPGCRYRVPSGPRKQAGITPANRGQAAMNGPTRRCLITMETPCRPLRR